MTTWDLNRLRYTIRKITGKYDTLQIPDSTFGEINMSNPSGIDDYINDFYLYDMPEQLRTLRLKNFFTFTTLPNVGTYSVPQSILSVEPPIYVDNYQFAWYQSPDIFYRIWPELNFINRNLFTPDGLSNTFSFFLTQTPVQQGTVVIGLNPNQNTAPLQSPALETFRDQDYPVPLDLPAQQMFVNPGLLLSNLYTGDPNLPYSDWGNVPGTGTVNYLSGQVNLNYVNAPPAGINTSCHYHPYVASRPRDIMFYQQQIFLRPIPNDSYSVKLMAYQLPTTVISSATNAYNIPSSDSSGNLQGFTNNNPNSNATNLPQFNEWWQLIAYGASLKIFVEDGEHEEYARYLPYFEKQLLLAQRKELKQLANQRIQSPYAENFSGPAWPIFPIY